MFGLIVYVRADKVTMDNILCVLNIKDNVLSYYKYFFNLRLLFRIVYYAFNFTCCKNGSGTIQIISYNRIV